MNSSPKYINRLSLLLIFTFLIGSSSLFAASYSCNGENVASIDAATASATAFYSENKTGRDASRYFKFTTKADGDITIAFDNTGGNDQELRIGTTCGDKDIYNGRDTSSDTAVIQVTANQTYYIRMQERNRNDRLRFDISFNFTAVTTAPPPPPDEPILADPVLPTTPICGTFEDMFQTRGACPGGGAINFTNAGQTLDGSTNVILDSIDNSLNTCQITTPTWVETQFETCGLQGDCLETGGNAESLNAIYANPPAVATTATSPAPATAPNETVTASTTLSDFEYNSIGTSYFTGITTTFSITNQLKINTINTTSDNNFVFTSALPYALEIGTLGAGAYGPHTVTANGAKNIKINALTLKEGSTIDLRATQTIKADSFIIGRGGSTVHLEAPYVNLNTMEFTNSGSGLAAIYIKADYIDIGTLDFAQGSTLVIEPYTPGQRVLFRSNSITATSSSTMIVPSGNYYTTIFDIPGTSNASSIMASSPTEKINLYINGNFAPGNNPAINAPGNDGNFDTSYPAANFMLFINGDLNTGGGGTTFNATIYVEGDAVFGHPTYIRGALSANTQIDVGQGQFIYDQSIDGEGFGECQAPIPTEPPLTGECGIFSSVITTYDHLSISKNDVYYSCTIAYPDGAYTANHAALDPTCYDPSGALCQGDGTCERTDPPNNRLQFDVYATTVTTTSVPTSSPVELTDYEIGNYEFSKPNQVIHFNPQTTYTNSTKKIMLAGDINHTKNGQTIIFEEGDYYFQSWNLGGNIQDLQIRGNVRIFIAGNFDYSGNSAEITDTGSSLFVYVAGDAALSGFGGGNSWLGMFLYVEGDAVINASSNAANLYGGITVEGKLDITGENMNFVYNAEGANNLGMGACINTIHFTSASYRFDEPAIDGGIPSKLYTDVIIALDYPVAYDVNVTYETYDDNPLGLFSAQMNLDYQPNFPNPQIVTIPAGQTTARVETVILRDDYVELDETWHAKLYNPSHYPDILLGDLNTTDLIINAQTEDDLPLCFADDFNTALDSKWRTLFSSGGFIPQIIDQRLRLTERKNNLATAVTKDYEFAAQHNMIIVEFEQYAYGGCESGQTTTTGGGLGADGADGIVMVLYDSAVGDSPTPGAYGGSMGYAQGHGAPGFQGGWLGLGLDEYGNFINPTEGRDGGLGFYPNNVTIRGSSDDLNGGTSATGYRYLSSNKNLPTHIATKTRAPAYPGDKYRLRIDARDTTKLIVSLEQDTGSGYQVIIPPFDAKALGNNQADSPDYVRLALTSGTGGGCNNHEIDQLTVRGVCRPYQPAPVTGLFDAWDPDQNINQRNISTKIANQDFTLNLASLNQANDALEAHNINVQYALFDNVTSQVISTWQPFSTANAIVPTSFRVATAHTDLRVIFQFCGLNTGTGVMMQDISQCQPGILNNGGYTLMQVMSSDNFSIRPDQFTVTAPAANATLPSGIPYTLAINADDINGVPTTNYTTILNVQNMLFNDPMGCYNNASAAALFASGLNFIDGVMNDPAAQFNDVGQLTMNFRDTAWTAVDQNQIDCFPNVISGLNINGQMRPACFIGGSVTSTFIAADYQATPATLSDFSANGYTYLANNVTAMNANLAFTVNAVNGLGNIVNNFNAACYATDLDITYNFNLASDEAVPTTLTVRDPANILPDVTQAVNTTQINASVLFPIQAADFAAGTSGVRNRLLNFTRNVNTPNQPMVMTPVSLMARSQTAANNAFATFVNTTPTGNATFVYGRTHAPRYRFSCGASPCAGNAPLYYEVFCNNCTMANLPNGAASVLSVDSINWYQNSLHNPAAVPTEGFSGVPAQANGAGVITNTAFAVGSPDNATLSYDGTRNYPYKSTMNMGSSAWLLYDRFNAAPVANSFEAEYYFEGGNWTGTRATTTTTDSNASGNTNRRIQW